MDATDSKRVEQLAESFLQELRLGHQPSIEDFARRYPDYADQIQELFPTLQVLEEFRPEAPSSAGRDPLPRETEMPSTLGEFRLLREVGRGGMGVVYEAEQASLGRRVALKVLAPASWRSPACRKRFQLEVRAAARLHHTNIVPVFGVGERDGVSFYAMQFIQGRSLDRVIEVLRRWRSRGNGHAAECDNELAADAQENSASTQRLVQELLLGLTTERSSTSGTVPDECSASKISGTNRAEAGVAAPSAASLWHCGRPFFRAVASMGVQVADAMHYAHTQGVLHRDIKPSNLMLDRLGTVWITDFGLAKSDDGDLTHTGDVVGTFRYLAPERWHGVSDPRSDIYGVGITLYELLVLQPAFSQTDRRRLIKEISESAPPPPRRIEPRIPQDLETIILKAIDREPNRRYQTAAELAQDLRCFLDDKPIAARRIRWIGRTWRWCRRNRLLATMATSLIMLMLLMVIGSTLAAIWMTNERNLAITSLKRVEAAEAIAQRRLFESYRVGARAGRQTGEAGQRFESLDALFNAARLLPQLDVAPSQRRALGNETLATLALTDLKVADSWTARPVLCFDRDLQHYAVGDESLVPAGTIRIRHTSDQREVCQLSGWGQPVVAARFSPDGRHLAVKYHGSQTYLGIWRVDSSPRLLTRMQNGVSGFAVAFSSDGTQLWAARDNGAVDRYPFPDAVGQPGLAAIGHPPSTIELDPSNQYLAVASSASSHVIVRHVDDGSIVRKFSCRRGGVRGVAWDPHGQMLAAACDDNNVYVWDVAGQSDEPRCVLSGHTAQAIRVSFHPSGTLASSGWDGTTRIWDVVRGIELVRVAGELIQFDPAGRQLAFRSASRAGIWEVGQPTVRSVVTHPDDQEFWNLEMAPDGRLSAAGTNRGAVLWDLAEQRELALIPLGETLTTTFHPAGDFFVTSGRRGCFRWPIRRPTATQLQIGPPEAITSWNEPAGRAAISADGRWIAVTNRAGTRTITSPWSDIHATVSLPPHGQTEYVSISSAGKWLATGTWQGTGIHLWNRVSGELHDDLMPQARSARVYFSPDGRWLIIATGDGYHLWQVDAWRQIHQLTRLDDQGIPGPVAFHPAGNILAVADPSSGVRLVSLDPLAELARLETSDSEAIASLCFTRCGQQLVIGRQSHLQIWDIAGSCRQLARVHLDLPWPAASHEPTVSLTEPISVEVILETNGQSDSRSKPDPLQARRQEYDEAIAGDPSSGMAYYRRGRFFEELDQPDDADADYRRAQQLFSETLAERPDDNGARHYRGHLLHRYGDYEAAARDFSVALQVEPDSSHLLVARGLAFHCAGRFAEAIDDYQRALTYADDASVGNRLAWLLVTGPGPLRDAYRALPLARAALQSSPGSPGYTTTLAMAYYRLERYQQAIQQLESLSEDQRSQRLPLLVLAMCHYAQGNHSLGEQLYQRALQATSSRTVWLQAGMQQLQDEARTLMQD